MIRCTVGVMAYNEEQNIVHVLHALLNQQVINTKIEEVIVVASGCTDRTVELAEEVARDHALIKVHVQQERAGKAAAINQLISLARGDVIVLVGADTLPDPTALEYLTEPFEDSNVGMTGARVVPLNDPRSFIGFTVQMLWHVHHDLAQRWPKLGELVAFRNVVPAIPVDTATDEVTLESLIRGQNYQLVYTPSAIVYNRGPETLSDFLHQRRRIFAGHLQVASTSGYVASSMPLKNLVPLMLDGIKRYPILLPLMGGAVLLECWGRLLGLMDFMVGENHRIWRPIRSSKHVSQQRQELTLVKLQCCDRGVNPATLMRRLRRIAKADGSLLWWDRRHNQVLFLVPSSDWTSTTLEERINRLATQMGLKQVTVDSNVPSYHLIHFASPRVTQTDMLSDGDGLQQAALGA